MSTFRDILTAYENALNVDADEPSDEAVAALSTARDALLDFLAKAMRPRVLVVVQGGVAESYADEGARVEVFDWDNYKSDPERTPKVPAAFADLATPLGIPVEAS